MMEVSRAGIYRYLGMQGAEPDERTKEQVEDALRELLNAVSPRFFHRVWPLTRIDEENCDFTCFRVKSRMLAKNLDGCERVILFAATIGQGADYLIRRYSRVEISRSVILQAAGAAMAEAFCREKCRELKEAYARGGWYLRPRFSPGYGDFSLKYQKDLCEALDAARTVGITLNDAFLMTPSKSVTAVIGLSAKDTACEPEGCEICGKLDCLFRRG